MKNLPKFLLFIALSISILNSYSRDSVLKDIYGNEILTKEGKKNNFSQAEFKKFQITNISQKIYNSSDFINQSNGLKTNITAHVNNLYSIMGSSIGRNSMHSVDIDNDGNIEIICSASTNLFGSGNYWYVMRYDSSINTWNQVWTSLVSSNSGNISTIEVVDYDNDGVQEILLGFSNGTIEIYNGQTKQLEKSITPTTSGITSIVFADADNDSSNEIVVSTSSNTYLINPTTYVTEFTIAKGGNNLRIGRLDDTNTNEIVLSSGFIYKLIGTTLTTEWNYNLSGEGYIELSDIDNDSKQEIVFAQGWYNIYVYDVDTKTTKYSLKADGDINSLLLADVNNDGVDDIIYGDGQWGDVVCHNSVTQAKLWSVANPEHGVSAINYSDLNKDGVKELIWSAGWTSSGSDYLYIYSLPQSKLLWRSDDVQGPFYAIATGDVDSDGKDEIAAVSYESESGYKSGILFIFDAETNKLKWKSDGNLFTYAWEGVYTVAIDDINNDGVNEIIVATDHLYDGSIWIVDGKTHTVKSSHIFSTENLDGFRSLKIDDIDNDGQKEIIVAGSSKMSVINPTNWAIEWSIVLSSSYSSSSIHTANVNGDGKKEIITCRGTIQIINANDQSYWTSIESSYTNLDIFDFNSDGIMDIVASTSSGQIVVIDGNSKLKLHNIAPETAPITAVRILKINNSIYFIYSSNNKVNIYQSETNCSVTQELGANMGSYESLKLYKSSSNSTDVLIGTGTSVLRVHLKILTVSSNNLTLASANNSQASFDISYPENWSISNNQTWLSLNNVTDSGNQTITITAQENLSVIKRTATLIVGSEGSISQVITVTQDGAIPVLKTTTSNLEIGAITGSTASFDITSNLNWTASSNENWLNLSASSGTGNLKMTLSAQANPTILSRTSTITISGTGVESKKITVTQAAGAPTLTVSNSNMTLSSAASSSSGFYVYSNTDWDIICDQSWLTLNTYSGTNNKVLQIIVSQNPTINPRTAKLTITGAGLTQIVTIKQNGQTPVLTATPSSVTIGSSIFSTREIAIQSNIDWHVSSNQPWLSFNNDSGTGSFTLLLIATENHTTKTRTANLTVSGTNVSTQAITVIQNAGAAVLTISTNSLTITGQNSTSFDIISNTEWTVISNQNWLTSDLNSGSGNATITLSAESNLTSSTRAASFLVLGTGVNPQVITVLQEITNDVDIVKENILSIYPNPVIDELFVNGLNNGTLQIINLDGKVLLSKEVSDALTKINVGTLDNGVYIIKLINEEGIKVNKFVKK